jgi:hypothetical protein
MQTTELRPLHCKAPGIWIAHDASWTFVRHDSDPKPKRWFAYEGDDQEPANVGQGHITLAEAVEWAEHGAV